MWNGSNVYKQVSYKNWATQNIHLAIATAFTGPFINLKNGNNRFFFKKNLWLIPLKVNENQNLLNLTKGFTTRAQCFTRKF